MQLTGAELLVQRLVDRNVDVLFGYPGGAVLDIYDALYDRKELKVIRTSHEQEAAHAADGYARSTRYCHQRTGCYESGNGNCHGLYGFFSHGVHHGKCKPKFGGA